jgi:hypothetical protein
MGVLVVHAQVRKVTAWKSFYADGGQLWELALLCHILELTSKSNFLPFANFFC